MEPRIFHGNLTPKELADALVAEFNRGNYHVQRFSQGDHVLVQITTQEHPQSGGSTSITISLQKVEDGVAVQIGRQAWFGVAASLGETVFRTWLNPWSLVNRLDDLAQDIESLQLSEEVWQVVENVAHAAGASFELSERLRRLVCSYCNTANPVGESNCVACGAPLGDVQPFTCPKCGFVVKSSENHCPNCGEVLVR